MTQISISMRIAVIAVALGGIFHPSFAQAILPSGWRLPTQEELSDDWRNADAFRRAEVDGDFNGDGKPDRALLLISIQKQSLGLFVFCSGRKNSRWFKVDVIDDKQAIRAMGIEEVHPGKYTTACGKGYIACKLGEPKSVEFDTDAINFFKTESASRYIFFDRHTQSFKKLWMSD